MHSTILAVLGTACLLVLAGCATLSPQQSADLQARITRAETAIAGAGAINDAAEQGHLIPAATAAKIRDVLALAHGAAESAKLALQAGQAVHAAQLLEQALQHLGDANSTSASSPDAPPVTNAT